MFQRHYPRRNSTLAISEDAIAAQFFQSYPPVRIQNPQDFISLPDDALGIFSFWNECPQTVFPLWVLSSKRAGIPKGRQFLWLGISNRGESALLAGDSKGDRVPLAGGIQWRVGPLSGRKNPMKPTVSWHTTLLVKSSVQYISVCCIRSFFCLFCPCKSRSNPS